MRRRERDLFVVREERPRGGPLAWAALVVGVLAALGLLALVVTLVGAVRSRDEVQRAERELPAVGTYDFAAAPADLRSSSPTSAPDLRVSVVSVLVDEDAVRVDLRWTNAGEAPVSWSCDPDTVQAGRWDVSAPRLEREPSGDTGSLCRQEPDAPAVLLAPGAELADFHVFPRDAAWGAGPALIDARTREQTSPGGDDPADLTLTVDLTTAERR
ncbi:hypothetical protein GTQ99_05540 [Kineococcus sp. T13]|uniref:hypothetical protein n=1 Tax=Kineococcus vitellinus TaxID=2696565 RepID=UPI00141333A9|nr:hypothetical protein [Kineococcus vitellinus]NAZ74888.1 hypothetical protein [Kineococcus vitellinus]